MSKFYSINSGLLIVGTVSGSQKDTRLFVESLTQRYSVSPRNCKYNIAKAGEGAWHFELQDSPETGSVLNQILEDLSSNPGTDIFFTAKDAQYQISKKPDGALKTSIRKKGDQVEPDGEGLVPTKGTQKGFRPVVSTSAILVWASAAAFVLSAGLAAVSASSSVAADYHKIGYISSASESPTGTANRSGFTKFRFEKASNLPSVGGALEVRRFVERNPESAIGKLEFDGDKWAVTPFIEQ